LIKAIRAVVCGKIYLCSEINALAIRDYYERLKQSENSSPGPLTPREREILQLLAEGERVRVIADKLCISARTVETHRRKIMDTLGLHSLAKLTKYAIMEGMTSTDIRNGLDNR
jgi:DNA-binding NarL/FixJ family response regulator